MPGSPGRRNMKLNPPAMLPVNKVKSVKLNSKNMQELQMDTLTLDVESKRMEEKLQQLKDFMTKEKKERGSYTQSRFSRWTSGKNVSLSGVSIPRGQQAEDGKMKKVLIGKQKIRVLKEEPPTVPSKPQAVASTAGRGFTVGSRLKGRTCVQCELKAAGLMCKECADNYCISCFVRFHQKGALKHHSMVPLQKDLKTNVTSRDVVSCFQSQGSSSRPSNLTHASDPNCDHTFASGRKSVGKPTKAGIKYTVMDRVCNEVFVLRDIGEKMVVPKDDPQGLPSSLAKGEYNEEESARYFQEALREWRGEKNKNMITTSEEVQASPRSVSMSAVATQVDLSPDRETEKQKKESVKVEFLENNLTYMERLLLRKLRRSPIQRFPPLGGRDLNPSLTRDTAEETADSSAEDEDFQRYYSSLFAVPDSKPVIEHQTSTCDSFVVIEVLNETSSGAENEDNNRNEDTRTTSPKPKFFDENMGKERVPTGHPPSRSNSAHRTKIAASNKTSSRADLNTACKSQPSKQFSLPIPSNATKMLSSPIPPREDPAEGLSFTKKAYSPTTSMNSGFPKKLMKKIASKSPIQVCSSSPLTSNTISGSSQISPRSLDKPTASSSFLFFSTKDPASGDNMSAIPEDHPNHSSSEFFSLRSTFTFSPSSSSQLPLLPEVYHSALLEKDSDSSLLAKQHLSSQSFAEPISSMEVCEASKGNLISRPQSQPSMCDPDCFLLDKKLKRSLSRPSAPAFPEPKSMEPFQSLLSPEPCGVNTTSCYTSAGNNEVSLAPLSPILKSSDLQNTHCRSSSNQKIVTNNRVKMEKFKKLSGSIGDEMSTDSLDLEEDSSGKKTQVGKHLTTEESEEEKHNYVLSHLEKSFRLAETETKRNLQADEPEQQSKLFMVMHKHSSGSGTELFSDLDGFLPPGLDTDTGHLSSTEHSQCETLSSRHSSLHDSDPTEDDLSDRSTPSFSDQARETQTPLSATVSSSFTSTPSPTLSAHSSHLIHGVASRPFSKASQQIMQICDVDQRGCEDPDLEMDAAVHILGSLEEEFKNVSNAGIHDFVLEEDDISQNGSSDFERFSMNGDQTSESEDENEEEDQQCRSPLSPF